MAETWLTQENYDRLEAELHELETTERHAVQQRILAAREEGDLRENAEYHQAKDDQAFLEARIAELKHLLGKAQIGEAPEGSRDAVSQGMRVTLRDSDGDELTYLFTSTFNTNGDDIVVSPESPLGKALDGRKVGEMVTYQAPGGEFVVEIVAAERA